jgi:hypothetical protein
MLLLQVAGAMCSCCCLPACWAEGHSISAKPHTVPPLSRAGTWHCKHSHGGSWRQSAAARLSDQQPRGVATCCPTVLLLQLRLCGLLAPAPLLQLLLPKPILVLLLTPTSPAGPAPHLLPCPSLHCAPLLLHRLATAEPYARLMLTLTPALTVTGQDSVDSDPGYVNRHDKAAAAYLQLL